LGKGRIVIKSSSSSFNFERGKSFQGGLIKSTIIITVEEDSNISFKNVVHRPRGDTSLGEKSDAVLNEDSLMPKKIRENDQPC